MNLVLTHCMMKNIGTTAKPRYCSGCTLDVVNLLSVCFVVGLSLVCCLADDAPVLVLAM